MTGYFDRLEAITINTSSPDGTVKGHYTLREGTTIAFEGRGIKGHTEKSLASQVNATLRGTSQGFDKASGSISSGKRPAHPPDTPQGRRAARYGEALSEIDARATSPRALVKVRVRGAEGTEVRIRPGTLGRLDVTEAQLESEINTAIDDAREQFGRQRIQLHKEFFSAGALQRKGLI